jgi:Mn2+/Fe2+ NRAMP family transporter
MLMLEIAAGIVLGFLMLALLPVLICGALFGMAFMVLLAAGGAMALIVLFSWPLSLELALIVLAVLLVSACAHRQRRWDATVRS